MRNQVPDRRGRGPQRQGRNFNENDRRQGRPNNQGDRKFKRHIAKRDHDGSNPIVKQGPKGTKGGRDKKADDRDLDRELRDYWIGQKGNKADIGTYNLK